MTTTEQHRLQLNYGITATLSYQDHMKPPFYIFGYVFDRKRESGEDGSHQSAFLSAAQPDDLLYKGICVYDLPMPADEAERAKFIEYAQLNYPSYFDTDSDDDYDDDS